MTDESDDKQIYLVQTVIVQRNLYAIATDKDLSNPNEVGELQNFLQGKFASVAELKASNPTIDIEVISPPTDKTHYHMFFDAIFDAELKDIPDEEKDAAIFDFDTSPLVSHRKVIPNDG